ncbi:Peptide methionine sulfoxide reductase MsrA [Pseudoalteromonas luteoviolacea B = ATCC 29581]|nr:Peptide methionine sulfoxide reductase MsrA [Pseudoalteromonas luteoviolacea B = ATCC 29581]
MEQLATFGGGCFWCIDAAFRRVIGVSNVYSGYMGGHLDTPTYREVCSGDTGHAEVVQLVYDDEKISFETLLTMFFALHDPTQLNRQGNDVGTQYRSVVFYHDDQQKRQSEEFLRLRQSDYSAKIVTEISPAVQFFTAEQYHQNYYNENPRQGYCSLLIAPKLDKFTKRFSPYLAI